jgi:hypothetical protein
MCLPLIKKVIELSKIKIRAITSSFIGNNYYYSSYLGDLRVLEVKLRRLGTNNESERLNGKSHFIFVHLET